MDPSDASILFNKAKLAAHLRGLVLIQVGVKAFKDAASRKFAGNTPAKRALLEALADQLEELKTNDDWCVSRTGASSVDSEFKAEILGDNDGEPDVPAKSDAQLILAFTSPVETNDAGREYPGDPKLVGFVTFSGADAEDRTIDDDDIEGYAEAGELLEVDLVCTNDAPIGTGSILLTFTMAKELKRRSRGGPKYKAVYMDIAEVKVKQGGRTVTVKPLLKIADRLGFEAVRLTMNKVKDSNPRVLTQFDDLIKGLPNMDLIETMCATRVRNGIPYCA